MNYWLKIIIDLAEIDEDRKVLDVGCGTGRYTIPLAKATGSTIIGIDLSSEMLERARNKDPGLVDWREGRAEALPFPDSSFHRIIMTFSIHHMDDLERVLEEAYRVLLPGGRLLVMTTSHNHFRRSPLHDFPGIRQIDLERFPTLPELKKEMSSKGFENVSYRTLTRAKTFYPVEWYLRFAREKTISTFTLLSEKDYEEGLRTFEKRLKRKYGDKVPYFNEYAFVIGERQ